MSSNFRRHGFIILSSELQNNKIRSNFYKNFCRNYLTLYRPEIENIIITTKLVIKDLPEHIQQIILSTLLTDINNHFNIAYCMLKENKFLDFINLSWLKDYPFNILREKIENHPIIGGVTLII